MRAWLALAAVAAVVAGAAAELVFDFRTPRSSLPAAGALAAVVSFPSDEPDPPKKLAGMYGLFVVKLAQLRDRLGAEFPAGPNAYDAGPDKNSCASRPSPELGFGRLTGLVHLRAQTYCLVRWDGALAGARPGAMLVSVTLADADPWMRPLARRACRTLTETALKSLGDAARPDYAACVLVDRPGRIRPGDARDTFKAFVYEIRDGALARMD
jgi:hypothetical protein